MRWVMLGIRLLSVLLLIVGCWILITSTFSLVTRFSPEGDEVDEQRYAEDAAYRETTDGRRAYKELMQALRNAGVVLIVLAVGGALVSVWLERRQRVLAPVPPPPSRRP